MLEARSIRPLKLALQLLAAAFIVFWLVAWMFDLLRARDAISWLPSSESMEDAGRVFASMGFLVLLLQLWLQREAIRSNSMDIKAMLSAQRDLNAVLDRRAEFERGVAQLEAINAEIRERQTQYSTMLSAAQGSGAVGGTQIGTLLSEIGDLNRKRSEISASLWPVEESSTGSSPAPNAL